VNAARAIAVLGVLPRDRNPGGREAQLPGLSPGHVFRAEGNVAQSCPPYSHPDLVIAATALHHGLTVVTRDSSDFVKARVPVFNPWEQ